MEEKDLQVLRHSAAHLLAHAISELFPGTVLTIGPATAQGFFYDCQPTVHTFKEADLETISKRMLEIAHRNLPLTHEDIPKTVARELYKNNPFKLELIENIPGQTVGLARQGDFYDLCRGGHVASTGLIKSFLLTGISGSYWRADRKNAPLQRISGTAFWNDKDLRIHLKKQEDAAKYDHRKIGKEMDLFSFQEEGVGFPFFHPKGKTILNIMYEVMRKEWKAHNYKEVETPTILDEQLWEQSGHAKHYRQNMYFCDIEDREYAVKPMNCPGGILIYKDRPRSYKELPLKIAEFGHVHRYEISGVLHGLFRVRAFTQDDSHIFCMQDQIEAEVRNCIQIIKRIMKKYGFETVKFAVSTKPENALGTQDWWDKATNALQDALTAEGEPFKIQEGEGAFYGPKLEVTIHDNMDRAWQVSTVQVDPFLPQNFNLSYIASGGHKEQPIMLHHATYGSVERFLGILLEHHKGHLPFWLAPIQARVLFITDDQKPYAQKVYQELASHDLRIELDESHEPLNAKIKTAQLDKIPWMLVVGQKEQDNQTITLRHASGKQEFGLTLADLISKIERA